MTLGSVITSALLGTMAYQAPHGTAELVVPTRITVTPESFLRGQVVSVKASFKTPITACPTGKPGFQIRVFDEKDLGGGEPVLGTDNKLPETRYIAWTNAPFEPKPEGLKVERYFEPLTIPKNAPSRIYLAVWHPCETQRRNDLNPEIIETHITGPFIGGKFFKLQCPGGPAGLCTYRPE